MLIKSTSKNSLTENDVTDETVYLNRRSLLKGMGYIGASSLVGQSVSAKPLDFWNSAPKAKFKQTQLDYTAATPSKQTLTPEAKVTSHNNFFEFGTDKSQPAELAQSFKVEPWQLSISGNVHKPYTLDYDQLFKRFSLEERIYRLRCVEAWSMVIPWIGFSLADVIKAAQPTAKAKYVVFETLYDPKQMPGQSSRRIGGGIDYPYVEGLTVAEAMNKLSFLSVGLYGKTLPPQNGAPIRLVVPWKYGFKSIKSIVSIKLTDKPPLTTWNKLAPREYGFYANVNPDVAHPRWSQASERRITTGGLFARNRIATKPFNGYGEDVAHLYKGLDLVRNF